MLSTDTVKGEVLQFGLKIPILEKKKKFLPHTHNTASFLLSAPSDG